MKRHKPVILFEKDDVVPETLRDALGGLHPVDCGGELWCKGKLDGARIRVVGIDDQGSPTPLTGDVNLDPTFRMFVHSLLEAGAPIEALPGVGATFPSPPFAAFVDLKSGTLSACAFEEGGEFYVADEKGEPKTPVGTGCQPFADVVSWTGTTKGRPVLQIQSHTSGKWISVETKNSDFLHVVIGTVTNAHHTSKHFALNEQLFRDSKLYVIKPCDYCINKPCACVTSLVDIAGCSNNLWP